jgi:hypothetical protein
MVEKQIQAFFDVILSIGLKTKVQLVFSLFFCSMFQSIGQTFNYSVEVNLSSRADTSSNKNKKEIYYLFNPTKSNRSVF